MVWWILLAAFALFGTGRRVYLRRVQHEGLFGLHLHARLEALFEPHSGRAPSEASRRELEAEADVLFRDAMTGAGFVPADWRIVVHVDELLGPTPQVAGPGGQLLHVADFEQRVRDGRIDLSKVG